MLRESIRYYQGVNACMTADLSRCRPDHACLLPRRVPAFVPPLYDTEPHTCGCPLMFSFLLPLTRRGRLSLCANLLLLLEIITGSPGFILPLPVMSSRPDIRLVRSPTFGSTDNPHLYLRPRRDLLRRPVGRFVVFVGIMFDSTVRQWDLTSHSVRIGITEMFSFDSDCCQSSHRCRRREG